MSLEVFYSYSHKDEKLRDALERHLSILKRNGLIVGWHDRRISAGDEWRDQIDKHAQSAQIILLLISSYFLNSEYCYDVEMKLALERHEKGEAVVIPIILRPVEWRDAPFAKLQALPRDAKPVAKWSNQEEAFALIAEQIRDIVKNFQPRAREKQNPSELKDLDAIDDRINNLLPHHILSPTANNTYQRFDSRKLMGSLVKAGIPIDAVIQIVKGTEAQLKPIVEGLVEVTTTHIRRAVLAAIYALRTDSQFDALAQGWAEVYARRFGNPDERLHVIYEDGNEIELNYPFLQDKLIPDLVREIMGANYEAELRKGDLLSNTDVRRMSEEIMEQAKGLNLYSVRYCTLFNLAYDLAIQPPHPWFVDQKSRAVTVAYNLERAKAHVDRLRSLIGDSDKAPFKHAIREIIHHACSAILAHYRAFLGVGQLGPLHQLIRGLRISRADASPILWSFSSIQKIEGDLAAIGSSSEEVLKKLDLLKTHLEASEERLGQIARSASDLPAIADRLVRSNPDCLLPPG